MAELEQIPLSEELLLLMRAAAQQAVALGETFITPRALLLAMLDDPLIGTPLRNVVNRERLIAAQVAATGAGRLPQDTFAAGDPSVLPRYDTLAFKTPDGQRSVWLSQDAYQAFIEGAQRVEGRYMPRHVALGLAAQAVHAPGILAAIRVEPGVVIDAIYKL